MSLFRRRAAAIPREFSLGLSTREAALLWRHADDGSWQQRCTAYGDPPGPEMVDGLFRGALEGASRARVPLHVTLSDDLVHWWLVTTPSGTASLQELERYAELRHEELFGHTLTGWYMRASWRSNGSSVCCAVPVQMLQVMSTLRSKLGVVPLDAVPASSRLAARWRYTGARPPVLACVAGGRAVVWWLGPGGAVRVRTLHVPAGDPRLVLDGEVQRARSLSQAAVEGAQGSGATIALLTAYGGVGSEPLHTKNRFEVYSADVSRDGVGLSDAVVAAHLGWQGGRHALLAVR